MQPVVAVDLGGTNLRAAFYPQGIPPAKRTLRIPSGAERGPEAVLAAMAEAIREVSPDPFPPGLCVGVAAPGPLDPNTGVVLNAPNLPGWINVPLRGWLQDALGVPVRIGNDANLAALGEWRYGAGQGVNHLIYLAISTGIGGGVISDGHLIVGWRGLGVEPGHMPMVEDGPLCGCGKRGHLEALASGTAIARRAAELLAEGQPSSLLQHGSSPIDAEAVSKAAEGGDALGQRVLREAGETLGRALAGLVHIFNPQRIILGGGVARAGDIFWEPIRRTLQAEVMNAKFLEGVDLVPAALGDDAGLVGALVLATLP